MPLTHPPARQALVKCVVWDLDETLWDGALLEGGAQSLKPGIMEIIHELDARGILQSVASKNDHEVAWPVVESFGLSEYLLFPHISWNSKADSIRSISECFGIGVDTLAFVDDQAIERDEVRYLLPQVTVIDSADVHSLLDQPLFQPRSVTSEGRSRRLIYHAEILRTEAAERFVGSRERFLETLAMQLMIHPIEPEDLARAEELTLRTNQLNTTGITYSRDELQDMSRSSAHLVLAVKLIDRYGSSGTVGLTVVEKTEDAWTILLLILSCRVAACGIGTALIAHLIQSASTQDVRLLAAFTPTDRNRQMYITYKFAGFRDAGTQSGTQLLEHDFQRIPQVPSHLTIISDKGDSAHRRLHITAAPDHSGEAQ